jgi:ketosteroid isomerase-like protein
MKKTWMWWLVGLLSLGSAGRSLAQETRSTEEAVVRLEEQWFEAQRSCEQLAPLMSDKVLITENDGKITNKAEALESCKNTKWSLIRIKEMNLTVFGDTVIATGDFTGEGTDATGKPLEVHERWTHTWVKMPNGQWQCVASSTSPLKPEQLRCVLAATFLVSGYQEFRSFSPAFKGSLSCGPLL